MLFIFLLGPLFGWNQTPYEAYGPQGVEVYNDLKTAVKVAEGVYKADFSYQMLEPKAWNKIGKMKNIQVLHLAGNTGALYLPLDFNKLTNLVYFCSVGNPLPALPDFRNFPSMMYLELMGTKIDSIPNSIAYLQRLKVLKFSATEDTLKLTKNFKYMRSLNTLILESVILDSCPRPVFRAENLKILSLKNCGVQALPENLEKMSNLESLNLDNNKLTRLPRGIYKMQKLTVLSLAGNKITKIPDTICHLQNLTVLDLRGNEISEENREEIKALIPGIRILY